MSNIKQIFAHLKQDPMVSAVSMIGTALSIFLIMVVVAIQQVKTAPFSPESNRGRMMYNSSMILKGISGEYKGSWTISGLSAYAINELYKPLKTPECLTMYTHWNDDVQVTVGNMPSVKCKTKSTDVNFWRVFNFKFI